MDPRSRITSLGQQEVRDLKVLEAGSLSPGLGSTKWKHPMGTPWGMIQGLALLSQCLVP